MALTVVIASATYLLTGVTQYTNRISSLENAAAAGEIGEAESESDGLKIRRCATENNATIFTSLDTVRVLLDVLEETTLTISTIDA